MKKLKALLLSGIIASIIISCSNGASNKMSQFELSPELVHIDSVMQQRPDSAFMMLIDTTRTANACVGATGKNYYFLLVSEALYKNDAPQLVRAELLDALAYFDSVFKANPNNETAALLSARSHYMNGVGFYENDSVFEACQQYYQALDIMQPFDCNPKFISLIYTRLANIYSDKFLIEPAIVFYKNALEYKKRDLHSNVANTLFFIGYEFEKGEKADSAIYYYNLSLDNISDTNSLLYRNVINRKTIATYTVDNDGEKAIKSLKNIIKTGEDYEIYDRYLGLGYIYLIENQYDTALVYLNEVFNDAPDIFLRTQSANHLYEIYNHFGDTIKADSYSRFITENTPPEFGTKAEEWQLTNMFQDYLQQKQQQELEHQKKRHEITIILIIASTVLLIAIAVLTRKKSSNIEGYNAFINEPVCKYILETAHQQQFKSKMDCTIYKDYALDKEQLLTLRTAADNHLNGFTERIRNKYPELTNDDVNYCILYLLGMKEPDIAAFMQKAYSTVSDRSRKLKKVFDTNGDLLTIMRKFAVKR